MSKHTPVPWRAVKRLDGDVEIVAGPDDSPLAIFHGDDGDPLCWPVTANARLAASAPDLLEALKQYQEANRIHNDSEADLYERARAAIEKAEKP